MRHLSGRLSWARQAMYWRWMPHLILVAGLAIRLLLLGSKSFWGDEAYSWYLARQSWVDLWGGGGNDPHHPPLYYVVLNLVLRVSDSEAALRLPSAVASTLTIAVVYLLARRLSDRKVAVFAMALVALSPMDVWYAQDARQAAMGTLFVTLAAYGVVRRDPPGWAMAGISLVLALFTYYVTALVWAACIGVALLLKNRDELIRAWLVATAAALVVFSPFQASHFVAGFADLRSTTAAPTMARIMELAGSPVVMLVSALLAALVAGAAVKWLSSRAPQLMATILMLGFVAVTTYAPVPRLYTLKRIVVVMWPLALILIAVAAWRWLPRRSAPLMIAGALILSLLASLVNVLVVPKDDWRGALEVINTRAEPADATWVVVYTGPWGDGPYLYYDVETPLIHETDPIRYQSLTDSVSGNVWIVASRTPRDRVPSSGPEAWLDQNWKSLENHDLHRIAVRRYGPP